MEHKSEDIYKQSFMFVMYYSSIKFKYLSGMGSDGGNSGHPISQICIMYRPIFITKNFGHSELKMYFTALVYII